MIVEDVLDSIRSAETRLLDADGRVALWHTLQDAMAEIKRLRRLLGSATLSAATEDKPVAWSVLESPHSLLFFDGEETAREVAFRAGVGARPLYRKPQPALTSTERDAIRCAISVIRHGKLLGTLEIKEVSEALGGLLGRDAIGHQERPHSYAKGNEK